MELTEIDRYNTRMPESINNHSIRVYENEKGEIVMLDRNTSCIPPCFELSKPFAKNFVGIVPIEDGDFCEGNSWRFAEKTMRYIYKNK